MLTRTGLGDDAALAHASSNQSLADRVVDLVRAGVVQVLAFEQDLRPANLVGQALGVINRRWPADVVLEVTLELGDECRILTHGEIRRGQLFKRRHEGFRHEDTAVVGEAPMRIRVSVEVRDRNRFVHAVCLLIRVRFCVLHR